MFEIGPIRLRPVEKEDMELVHKWENDFSLMLYSRGKPENMIPMESIIERYTEDRKNDRRRQYLIEHRESGKAMGTATIRIESWGNVRTGNIGTYLDKAYWNRGLGKVITLALLELSFYFMNLDKCEAYSIEYNKRAHKVLETCGFRRGGVHRKGAYVMGRTWNWYFFDILREEYMPAREKLIKSILGHQADEYLATTQVP
ncbi:MAG: GNAT family N-acetyltransferase [Euryarchaeota archaeon]|nr:GNAT family N-acetyltransferase [Euryarchaeota archaeon]